MRVAGSHAGSLAARTRSQPTQQSVGASWPDIIAGLRRGCEAARQAHRRHFRHLQADWSKGPAMVMGELTGWVLALDVSVPCP
jgi:hypothetical protein